MRPGHVVGMTVSAVLIALDAPWWVFLGLAGLVLALTMVGKWWLDRLDDQERAA